MQNKFYCRHLFVVNLFLLLKNQKHLSQNKKIGQVQIKPKPGTKRVMTEMF